MGAMGLVETSGGQFDRHGSRKGPRLLLTFLQVSIGFVCRNGQRLFGLAETKAAVALGAREVFNWKISSVCV